MKRLHILEDETERTALSARWPEPVLSLSEEERERLVRVGRDTVMFDDVTAGRRGFVRAVLTVPLGHPQAPVYGVFVEVDRDAYEKLSRAFKSKVPVRVWGKLATKLPYLDDAFGTEVEIVEDGSDLRTRVVGARSPLIKSGPAVGRRS